MFKILKNYKKKKEVKKEKERVNRTKLAYELFTSVKQERGDLLEFVKTFRDHSLIMLIIGRRGAGKTALGMKFVEAGYHLKKRSYVLGFSNSKIPSWVKKVDNISQVPNNSLVLVDEAGISFSARSSMKTANKNLAEILAIARHKNLSLIFITQNSAMLDLNVLRLADILLFKEPSLLQTRFERKGLQDIFEKVSNSFKELDSKKEHFYIISDDYEGLVKSGLPDFWNESISKSFSKK